MQLNVSFQALSLFFLTYTCKYMIVHWAVSSVKPLLKWSTDTDWGLQLLLLCSFRCKASVDKVLAAAAVTEVTWEKWGAVCASVQMHVKNCWLTASLKYSVQSEGMIVLTFKTMIVIAKKSSHFLDLHCVSDSSVHTQSYTVFILWNCNALFYSSFPFCKVKTMYEPKFKEWKLYQLNTLSVFLIICTKLHHPFCKIS